MSILRQRRIQVVQNIIEKDTAKYGLLTSEPFASNISGNFQQFPNEFLETLYKSIVDFEDYHVDVMQDDPVWGAKYKEFYTMYQQLYQIVLAQQQQQYYAYIQQQQQMQAVQGQQFTQGQQYQAQQGYNQQNQFGANQQQQQYGQQGYKNYGHQNQYQQGQQTGHQGQQGYNNQQGQNFGNQQRNYQHRQNQNPNYQTQNANYPNQPQDQTQGHQQQQRYQQNNQQNRTKPYQQRYPNQQGGYEQQQQGDNTQQQHYQHNRQHNNNYHHGGQYQPQHRHHYNNQHVEQPEAVEVVPEVPAVVVPPAPPAKPEPQPTKFSLKEIREFITQWSDKDKELVNKELIEKVNEVNGWTKGETSFEEKPEKQQQQRKYDNKNRQRGGQRGAQRGTQRGAAQQKDGQQGFSTGSKFNRAPEVPPELVKKNTGLVIAIGKNETLESRKIKDEIKKRAGQDFATLMEKQNESLGHVEITTKEISYNLNLLAPENLKEIQKDLTNYLFGEEIICRVLVEQIIEKAWGQPKYASTYARLCSEFSKIGAEKFTFQHGKDKKKENPFKVYLISKVQHSFDKKVEEVPVFSNEDEKDNWLKETKKKILGNVKFIAELIRSKVLKKKIMKICISQMLFTFLAKYYYYRKSAKIVDSYYDYYFEALIEFIENVGEFYEKMDESSEKKEQKPQPYEPAERKVIDLIEMNEKPPEEEIEEISNLRADDYFELFKIIDSRVLRKVNTRLSALLLNLTERRTNNWQKHHAESEGPKKLKQIKEDIAKEEVEMNKVKQQKRQNMEHLHDLIKAMFKDWENSEKNEKAHFRNILKEYGIVEFFTACLNQIADEKKENIVKRLDLFDIIFESYFDLEKFKSAWFECIKYMAFNAGDYPFAGATIALILKKVLARDNTKLKEFWLKTEDEDEEFFVQEVFGKLYYYTKLQEIKDLTEPSKKYSNMLDA